MIVWCFRQCRLHQEKDRPKKKARSVILADHLRAGNTIVITRIALDQESVNQNTEESNGKQVLKETGPKGYHCENPDLKTAYGSIKVNGGGAADPPLLIGGSIQNVIGVVTDYLTVTVGENTAKQLIQATELREEGKSAHYFKQTENRACWGGHCWRRFEPQSQHKVHGLDYESWEWDGQNARWATAWLKDKECESSRFDIAFDCRCGEQDYPLALVKHLMGDDEGEKLNGYKVSVRGPLKTCSVYLGTRQSGKHLRIYRKDEESPEECLSPTMRIEMEYHKRHAKAAFNHWQQDPAGLIKATAKILQDMTGIEFSVTGEVKPLEKKPKAELTKRLYTCFKQYGPTLLVYLREGGDLIGLLEMAYESSSRNSKYKAAKTSEQIQKDGIALVDEAIRKLFI